MPLGATRPAAGAGAPGGDARAGPGAEAGFAAVEAAKAPGTGASESDAGMVPRARPPAEDPLERLLFEQYQIVVPVFRWPQPPLRLLRISAQIYNRRADYEHLAAALGALLRP